ncbi:MULTISPECIES: hypothetical protein [Vibrio]|uniref:hypothetical protein n=1 Tax=Vibrio TaxID=662 RepID=UPI0005865373|nr:MULTISPECIES: hypothetical protein [Vibrio]MCM5506982.1 hypothetical protein [Vibrio sp. SCSIO 43169]MDE3896547.1 hypothetical protein [Vibrio sp. CC007]QFT36677.1 hypothetical protein FIU99_09535 [Vibrio sp. THAF64]QGM34578.1 hypothetical protein GGC04_09550 [Vibrio sp. THAF191d]QGN70080.1 hypothetical protein GGC03_09555 [Vibrio sp. THAF191c]
MPIAHCTISPDLVFKVETGEVMERWGSLSEQPTTDMTINFVRANRQEGRPYLIIANLFLPSVWSEKSVSALQLGLAKALSESFSVESQNVLVMTTILSSGFVVENGREVTW